MITIDALCAAIDGGDDTALLALADALEEMGDARAAGLRSAVLSDRRPYYWTREGTTWAWAWLRGSRLKKGLHREWTWLPGTLARAVFRQLKGGVRCRGSRHYKTRSAAFLALAEA